MKDIEIHILSIVGLKAQIFSFHARKIDHLRAILWFSKVLRIQTRKSQCLTTVIQAADSSLERAEFQVLLNENSAIFVTQVQRTADRRSFKTASHRNAFFVREHLFDRLNYHSYYLIENFRGYPRNLNVSRCQLLSQIHHCFKK